MRKILLEFGITIKDNESHFFSSCEKGPNKKTTLNKVKPYWIVRHGSRLTTVLNYSHSRNPNRVRAHTNRHIQAPREPLNSRVCWRVCTLSQDRT
jgi:hypothetical protein